MIKVNGELLTQFIRLDDILDSSVGQLVTLLLLRGGKEVEVEIKVGDLQKITPDRFVSVAGGSFHTLSYQQARFFGVACQGVYVCDAAGSWLLGNAKRGWIIQTVDHKETPDLKAFIDVTKAIPDKALVVVRYTPLHSLRKETNKIDTRCDFPEAS